MRIADAAVRIVTATPSTHWVFLQLSTDNGLVGLGEALLGGREAMLRDVLAHHARGVLGRPLAEAAVETPTLSGDAPLGLLEASALSAIDQALWDLRARAAGQPLYGLLGPARRLAVPLYANINRGTKPRTPENFAHRARAAVAEGFRAVKLAPLDGVTRTNAETAEGRAALGQAVERVLAVREAIGPDAGLMVDCHWRLTLPAALRFLEATAPARLGWLEDVLPYSDLAGWTHLRAASRVPLAGGEHARGTRDLLPFLERGLWDVILPDVRYCGGITGMHALGPLLAQYQVALAPHNPRGPVGTLASGHLAAVAEPFTLLEFQWGECDWRGDLVGGGEVVREGCLHLGDGPGLGAGLDEAVAAAHPWEPQGGSPARETGISML